VNILRRFASSLASPPSTHDAILEHYRGIWGKDQVEEVHWTPGPVAARLPDLHIAKVRPASADGAWIFATIGAWRATEDIDHGLEFMAVAQRESAVVMERLGMLAYYHAGPPENRLGAGHRVPIGEPWVEGSTLEVTLISRPYPWGLKLEHCQLADRHIQVLWALPISEKERDFAREHGLDALEQQFEAARLDYLDPFRRSVV
jgi:hypothetical protein